jgi:hypothetical protein
MKNLALYLLLIVTIKYCSISAEYELTPINVDYKGIEVQGDTVIAYGTYGALLVSYNDTESWQQYQAFDKGTVIKIFWDNESIIAISDEGGIAVSGDCAKSWKKVSQLDDSVFAVVKYQDGYFLRSGTKLYTIDNEYKLKDTLLLESKIYYKLPSWYPMYSFRYKYSITKFKNYFIAQTDSSKIIILNYNLKAIDTLSFSGLGLCTSCYSGFQIRSDSLNLYVVIDKNIYKSNDLNNWEKVYGGNDNFKLFELFNNSIYVLDFNRMGGSYSPCQLILYEIKELNNFKILTTFDLKELSPQPDLNEFAITNSNIYIAGGNNFYSYQGQKFLLKVNYSDSIMNLISNAYGMNYHMIPDIIDKKSIILYTGTNNFFNSRIYGTDDNYITIKPKVKYLNNDLYLNFIYFGIKYFDIEKNILYLGGITTDGKIKGIFKTTDLGTSFTFKPIEKYYNFTTLFPDHKYYPKLKQYPNIQKIGDTFYTSTNVYYDRYYTKVLTYTEDFDLITQYQTMDYSIDYVYAKDTNTFLIHGLNAIDDCYEIKYTTNKGADWVMVKKYSERDSMFYYKELDFKGRKYIVMLNYNSQDSIASIEA